MRVKDIDFEYRQITVRDGKGNKDRVTMSPEASLEPLKHHLAKVRSLHQQDLDDGCGEVYLPFAWNVNIRRQVNNGAGSMFSLR